MDKDQLREILEKMPEFGDEILEDLTTKELTEKLADPETKDHDKSYIYFILDERKDAGEDLSDVIPELKRILITSDHEAEDQTDNVSLVSILVSHYAKEKNWSGIKEVLECKNDIIRSVAIGNLINLIEEGEDISPLLPYLKDKTDLYSVRLLCTYYLEKGEFNEVCKYYNGRNEERRIGAFQAILETAKRGVDVSFFKMDIKIHMISDDARTIETATMILVYQYIHEGDWHFIGDWFRKGDANERRGIVNAVKSLPGLTSSHRPTAFKKEHIHPTVYKIMEKALYDEDREVRNAASKGFTLEIRQDILGVPENFKIKTGFIDNIHEKNKLKIKVRSLLINTEESNYINEIKEDITPLLIEFMTDSAPEVATNSTNILLERLRESVFEKIDRADYFPALQEIKEFSNMVNKQKASLHPKLRRGIISFLNQLSGIVQDKMNKRDSIDPLKLKKLVKDIKDYAAERKMPVKQR